MDVRFIAYNKNPDNNTNVGEVVGLWHPAVACMSLPHCTLLCAPLPPMYFVAAGLATPRALGRALSSHAVLLLFVIVGCLVGRGANVYGCSWLVERYRRTFYGKATKFVLWFSGLRGGVAFALSVQAAHTLVDRCVVPVCSYSCSPPYPFAHARSRNGWGG